MKTIFALIILIALVFAAFLPLFDSSSVQAKPIDPPYPGTPVPAIEPTKIEPTRYFSARPARTPTPICALCELQHK